MISSVQRPVAGQSGNENEKIDKIKEKNNYYFFLLLLPSYLYLSLSTGGKKKTIIVTARQQYLKSRCGTAVV